jgi:hypothetical protein
MPEFSRAPEHVQASAASSDDSPSLAVEDAGSAERKLRRLKRALALVGAVAVAALAFGLGVLATPSTPTPTPSTPIPSPSSAAETPDNRPAAAQPPDCLSATQEISDSLRTLTSRLEVGVNVGEYTALVGDARVTFDAVDTESPACDEALDHFDMAILTHTDAAAEWELCIEATNPACFVDNVGLGEKSTEYLRVFRLHRIWARAEAQARRGDAALETLHPDPS